VTGSARGRRGSVLLVLAALTPLGSVAAAAAGEPARPSPPGRIEPAERAEIIVVAGAPCAPQVRAVIADQLADLTAELVWTCRDRLDPEDLFRHAPPGASSLRVWIDLRVASEARLTLERADRFVVRRIALSDGLDELGREQIGQIVRFAALAVRAGEGETLTRTEARSAVADWPPPRGREIAMRTEAALNAAPRPTLAFGAIASVVALSREIPLVHELALGAEVGAVVGARISGWLEAAYRLPAPYRADPIGVEIGGAALRLGLAAGTRGTRYVAAVINAGIGVERISFAPIGAAASVEPAPADAFWSATARVALTVGFRATDRLTIGARLACDIAAADVHYDLRDAAGAPHRVLTPFRLAPGLGLGVTWRL
jgi:hypothetical protein